MFVCIVVDIVLYFRLFIAVPVLVEQVLALTNLINNSFVL